MAVGPGRAHSAPHYGAIVESLVARDLYEDVARSEAVAVPDDMSAFAVAPALEAARE